MKDEDAPDCYECRIPFDVVRRKHHCRRCRNVFCEKCSSKRDRSPFLFVSANPRCRILALTDMIVHKSVYVGRCLVMNEHEPVRLCDRCFIAAKEEVSLSV